ncbi:PH domain-containing protein [Streptomyces phaeolivaceus]|uniref:PH domain-containing protein n=1 Tax=Streptomyces phaeolivaceus TaxID=2653200 RepID=A0A5P8KA43_9ACTN|nr:PH domain-containing protein [Streptomyces phaeolivaceus]QFQ99409.1 PH domain-containing protein [Streptomyces phaeolivaceus]
MSTVNTAAPSIGKNIRLRPPRNRVEKRAVWWWTARVLLSMVTVLGGLAITYWLWEASRTWVGPVFVGLTIVHAVTAAVMPTWRYHVHRWECTDLAVYELKGWLEREWRIVPISRIQSVDVVRGPLQQAFRLATLRVITASPEGQIKIVGLDAEIAAQAAADLVEITQATPGDAT